MSLKILMVIGLVMAGVGMLGGFWLLKPSSEKMTEVAVPTRIIPTLTPRATATATVTLTASPTATHTATSTLMPTLTATLATAVLESTAMMPGIASPTIDTATRQPVIPAIQTSVPNATDIPEIAVSGQGEFEGWVTFESDHPAVHYRQGQWEPVTSYVASRGQYHYSLSKDAEVEFTFLGSAFRIRYVTFRNGGQWAIYLDDEWLADIDANSREGTFPSTRIIALEPGIHQLRLRNISQPAQVMMALDAIQVYQAPLTSDISPSQMATESPMEARRIDLLQAPPTIRPTATLAPPIVLVTRLMVGYDENMNRKVDLNEGVQGVSVRLVEGSSNRVLAHGFTDERGFLELQAVTASEARLVIPYFGESYPVTQRQTDEPMVLLIEAGNQPGLLP